MAIQAYNLIPTRTKKTRRVVKNSFTAIIPDASLLGETVQRIAAHEIMREIKNGNPVQNLIVDNRDSKPFNQATFRVTALFSDPKVVAIATMEVIRVLKDLTRKKTRTARRSYQLWMVKDKSDPGRMLINNAALASVGVIEKFAAALPLYGRLVVVGPMTDYGRKLYWNPKGNFKGRARYKIGYEESGRLSRINAKYIAGERSKRDTNMRDLVLGRVKRKYPGTLIIGRWVEDLTINGDNRWPGIAIGIKSKGRL